MKQDYIKRLKGHFASITQVRKALQDECGQYVSKLSIRQEIEALACSWFDAIEPKLKSFGIQPEKLEAYSGHFRYLLKLSARHNRKSSYEGILDQILKGYQDDLVISVQTFHNDSDIDPILQELLAEIQDPLENEYLSEAINCTARGFLRAGVTLGWSAAVDRIHRKIEEIGFEKFNQTSIIMANQTTGRFKTFNQKQSISSLSELRMVFDNVMLWVIEGMTLIDNNQHTRLKSCFDMRCHSSHPGDAPITKYNVISFFSDLNEIVFKNPTLALKPKI